MIQVGLIGYGYWGPNLVRNFFEAPGCRVAVVSDLRPDRVARAAARYPSIGTTVDHRELINDPGVDLVAIATPVSTHFELAMQALRAGKHVLLEKPLAANSEQGEQLIEEADRRRLTLMVDHTFVYTSAVGKIRELVAAGALGDVYYYDSVRVNLGLFQHDVNVIWDLAVHDLAILDYVVDARPIAVSATGISNVPGKPENIAYVTLFFAENVIAHLHLNWLSPVKVRKTLIGGSQKMIVYDDLEATEKVKVYDKGITVTNNLESFYQMLIGYRTGDMWAPNLPATEALQTEVQHLLHCIEHKQKPTTDGEAGLRVVQVLEAASQSMKERGRPVELTGAKGAAVWSRS
ncbi:MAG: Gfo/Idh/MocA family oxidoreductase [Acidobacteriia bacterium]|nr:Gfo/Idh/MocA family oxidoreductase [Terriglobia bacterium]